MSFTANSDGALSTGQEVGSAAIAIRDQFAELHARIPKSVYSAGRNPDASDNLLAGYKRGSRWLNSSTRVMWECVHSTNSTATWATYAGASHTHTPASLVTKVDMGNVTGDVTVDADDGVTGVVKMTLTGDITLKEPTNPVDNQRIVIKLKQDGAGNHAVTFTTTAGGFRFGTDLTEGGTVLTVAASKTDILTILYDVDDDFWDVIAFIQGF